MVYLLGIIVSLVISFGLYKILRYDNSIYYRHEAVKFWVIATLLSLVPIAHYVIPIGLGLIMGSIFFFQRLEKSKWGRSSIDDED